MSTKIELTDSEIQENLRKLIVTIVEGLVDDKKSINLKFVEEETGEWTYHLTVSVEESGRVIGKQGKIIKAIRTVIRSGAARYEKKVNVVVDDQ